MIDADVQISRRTDVQYVYHEDMSVDIDLRHAGPVGFLAAKADALDSRDEPKDGYDVAWWCMNAGDSAEAVADLVTTRDAFSHPRVPEAINMLQSSFKTPKHPGPTGYADILYPRQVGSELYERTRNEAFARVRRVVETLADRVQWTVEDTPEGQSDAALRRLSEQAERLGLDFS